MFTNSNMPAVCLGFPDVCKTPTPAGPIPIPYPNIAFSTSNIPSIFNSFVTVGSCNLLTQGVVVEMGCEPITEALMKATSNSNAVKGIKSAIASNPSGDTVVQMNFPQPIGAAKFHHNGKSTDFQCSSIGMRISGMANSPSVFCSAMPSPGMLNVTGQNGNSGAISGPTLTPCQVKIMVLT